MLRTPKALNIISMNPIAILQIIKAPKPISIPLNTVCKLSFAILFCSGDAPEIKYLIPTTASAIDDNPANNTSNILLIPLIIFLKIFNNLFTFVPVFVFVSISPCKNSPAASIASLSQESSLDAIFTPFCYYSFICIYYSE